LSEVCKSDKYGLIINGDYVNCGLEVPVIIRDKTFF